MDRHSTSTIRRAGAVARVVGAVLGVSSVLQTWSGGLIFATTDDPDVEHVATPSRRPRPRAARR